MTVYLLATLDTKGREAAYVRDVLGGAGVETSLIDAGCLGEPAVAPDISRETLLAEGGYRLDELVAAGDRGRAVNAAADSAAKLLARLHAERGVAGLLALGGSAGTTIGTAAMRALPLGVPKLMVSTLASGQVRHFVGDKDIVMVNSVVDIAGVNRVSRLVLANAARAMAGMVTLPVPPVAAADRPLVAASMFGVTTPCVEHARRLLEARGYEVLVFHATGGGGQAMEALISEGLLAGVLDLTTTELADELVGGFLTAGPDRLTAAGRRGVPQVVSVGATDMVNFHAPETVPERFAGRTFYRHNAHVTLMRTTAEENAAIGADIGRKLAAARGPVSILLPRQGVSAIDRAGQPFDDPVARRALFDAVRRAAGTVEVSELDCHINDPSFAEAAVEKLCALIEGRPRGLPVTGRLAGIDFGTVRIGVALSDSRRTLASPFDVYHPRGGPADAAYFQQLVASERIAGFVVGLPVHLDGRESQKSHEARRFGAWLETTTGLPVVFFDERFTTVEADAYLGAAKLTKKQRQARRDKLAAQIMLAAYLESPASDPPRALADH
jgi:putative transcription antitermination factor YqgF